MRFSIINEDFYDEVDNFSDDEILNIINESYGSLEISKDGLCSELFSKIVKDVREHNYTVKNLTRKEVESQIKSFNEKKIELKKKIDIASSNHNFRDFVRYNSEINSLKEPVNYFNRNIYIIGNSIDIIHYENIKVPWIKELDVVIVNEENSYSISHDGLSLHNHPEYTIFSSDCIVKTALVLFLPDRIQNLDNIVAHELNHCYQGFCEYKTLVKHNVDISYSEYIKQHSKDLLFFNKYIQNYRFSLIDFSEQDVVNTIINKKYICNNDDYTEMINIIMNFMYFLSNNEIRAYKETMTQEMKQFFSNNKQYSTNIKDRKRLLLKSSKMFRFYYNIEKVIEHLKNNVDSNLEYYIFNYFKNVFINCYGLYKRKQNKSAYIYINLNQFYSKMKHKVDMFMKHSDKIFAHYYMNNPNETLL